HHHALAALPATPAFLHHRAEALPGLGRGVLPAELLLAVAPAARGDAYGEARLGSGGVHRDRRAEAVAEHSNPLRVCKTTFNQEIEGAPRVFHLLHADHAAALAFAFPAAAHVEAKRHVPERREDSGHGARVLRLLVAAEAVQHEESG